MINQKKSERVRMGSWLLKLLPLDMKTKIKKNKDQQKTILKNNRKIKNN